MSPSPSLRSPDSYRRGKVRFANSTPPDQDNIFCALQKRQARQRITSADDWLRLGELAESWHSFCAAICRIVPYCIGW